MTDRPANPLLSAQMSADSGLHVVLHPLPLLEMSDYITRGCLRQLEGAMVGALLGQQNGREITVEHSFTCKADKSSDGLYRLDIPWFTARLDQMKAVHKNPPLDLVGWFALVDKSGPAPMHLPIHHQILEHNESAILVGFHVEDVLHPVAGDPLPITIYESSFEADDSSGADSTTAPQSSRGAVTEGEDREMKDSEAAATMVLRFRPLPYSTETGQAEMIAMQFIREGGANATAAGGEKATLGQRVPVDVADAKGKRRAVAKEEAASKHQAKGKAVAVPGQEVQSEEVEAGPANQAASQAASQAANKAANRDANLTKEEAEFVSALQTKANAIRMMKSRVDLIVAYLEKLPPRFLAGKLSTADAVREAASSNSSSSDAATVAVTAPSHAILRQIQALVTNIGLAAPARQEALQREILAETADVRLVSLLADLTTSADAAREAGKKFAVVEAARSHKTRQTTADSSGVVGGAASGGAASAGSTEPITFGSVGDLLT